MAQQTSEVFIYYGGSVNNACTNCGTDSTSGSWRKGWVVAGGHVSRKEESKLLFPDPQLHHHSPPPPYFPVYIYTQVNLCNRCGQRYHKGLPFYSEQQQQQGVEAGVHPFTSIPPPPPHPPNQQHLTGKRHKREPTAKQASKVDEDTEDGHNEQEEEETPLIHPSRGGNGKFKRFQPHSYTRRGAVHNEEDDEDDQTIDDQQQDEGDDVDATGVDAYYSNVLRRITQQDRTNLLFTARRLAVSASRQQGSTNNNIGIFHREPSPALIDTRSLHYHPNNSQLGIYTDILQQETPAGREDTKDAALVDKGPKVDKGSKPTADDDNDAIIIARDPSLENGGDGDQLFAEMPYFPGLPIYNSTLLAVYQNNHDHDKGGGDDGVDIAAMLQQPVLPESLMGRTLLHQISMSPAPSPLHIPLDNNGTTNNGTSDTPNNNTTTTVNAVATHILPPPHIAASANMLSRAISTTTTTTTTIIPAPETSPQIPLLPSPPLLTNNTNTTCSSAVERMCSQYATILQECHISEQPSPLPATKQKWLPIKDATQMIVGLGSVDIPLPLLEETGISAVVAQMMGHPNLELASEACIVADKWRKLAIETLQAAQNMPSL